MFFIKKRTTKVLIRPCKYIDWSATLLFLCMTFSQDEAQTIYDVNVVYCASHVIHCDI